MTSEFVWFRHEFPWLSLGFIHAIASDYAAEFQDELEARGFEVRRMSPSDKAAMFRQLGEVFAFPDYYGGSGWASVWDCLQDTEVPSRLALVWEDAPRFAASDPKAFGEACHVLSDFVRLVGQDGRQLVLVLLGDGPSFERP